MSYSRNVIGKKLSSTKISKPLITEDEYRVSLVAAFGLEWAAICQLPEADRIAALGRIDQLQGMSPRDRAWPTEGGNEPTPEEGWDPSGTYRPAVVRQVYDELVRSGKVKA